ncbi:Anaphase-promoting complex subunit 1, partial [Grifola frondosa]
ASPSSRQAFDDNESDLLKSIRSTLRGTRGSSNSSIRSLSYVPPPDEASGDEELSWDTYNVIFSWGGIMRKRWNFEEEGQPVQWACIAWFEQPSSLTSSSSLHPAHYTDDYHDQSTPIVDTSQRPTFGPFTHAQRETKRRKNRACIIGKMFLLGGGEYTFYLPVLVRKAWPLYPHGVMIQRVVEPTELEEAKVSDDTLLPTIFTFTDPVAEMATVAVTEGIKGGFIQAPLQLKEDCAREPVPLIPAEEHILWVSQRAVELNDDVIITLDIAQKRLSIWRYVYVKSNHLPAPLKRRRDAEKKRTSMSGNTSFHRRYTNGVTEETPATPVPADGPELPPLGALPGMPPRLTATTMMADLMGGGASTDWSDLGRDFTIRPRGGRPDPEFVIDPSEQGRMKPQFWLEKLHSEDISESDVSVLEKISVAAFDQRWDGKFNRSLIGICLPATQTLLVFSLTKQEDLTMAVKLDTRLSATCIISIRATRETVRDLLILKPDGHLAILTHGTLQLPLQLTDPVRETAASNDASEDKAKHIISFSDSIQSSVTLKYSDGSRVRLSLNLIPPDSLTNQCLLMLAMILPADSFFSLHSLFLHKWSLESLPTAEGVAFDSFALALCELFDVEVVEEEGSDKSGSKPIDAWDALATTYSSSRFREDPVLLHLRLPTAPTTPIAVKKSPQKPHRYLSSILYALHQVAEDQRLSLDGYKDLYKLVPIVCRFALIIRPEWADYWKRLCPDALDEWPSQSVASLTNIDDHMPVWPPDMAAILYGRINNPDWARVTILRSNSKLRHPLPMAAQSLSYMFTSSLVYTCPWQITKHRKAGKRENGLTAMVKLQVDLQTLRHTPLGLAAPLREATRTCQLSPSGDWPVVAYQLIGRNDLAEGLSMSPDLFFNHGYRSVKEYILPSYPRKTIREHIEDVHREVLGEVGAVSGVELDLEDFTRIRFGQDRRLEELSRMLCSSAAPSIRSIDRPELNEHEQAKEQQMQVIRMAERTLSLALGRALFTFGAVPTVTRESFAIPKIEYAVRLQPQNLLITPKQARYLRNSQAVESSWIKFNKPSELTPEHAGFLYALGLTDVDLAYLWISDPKHEMTSIGVLLGLAAANVGSSNRHVTKLIAVHTPAFLPTPSVDLNVPLVTQAAGLMGIGLLYMGTKNRRMAEVCLNQINRKDLFQPDLTNEYREAYTLSGALACGMIMLGKGSAIPADLAIQSRLRVLIHGEGHVMVNAKPTRPSFDVNLTSPAATITLGLMYLKTERQDVADILAIPDTLLALNHIQPGFLLLRALARGLILWDKMAPNSEWVTAQIPPTISAAMNARFKGKPTDDAYELAYYNIIAGCCFAIALKYAGTAREEAYLLIIHYYDMFSQLAYTNKIKRSAIRDGLNLISLSLNMVMAGTGEINCLRRLRYAYGMYNQPIKYGTYVSTHMSLGLLFLGGGRFTLGTSDAAIACMVAAFFPRWAQISSENKSYLQALRYLWVLAVEPRCLIARDVDTKEVVYLPVKIKVKDGNQAGTTQLISPTLIPDLDKLLSIRVDTPRYWPFYLDIANFPRHKESLLRSQTLYVKRRTAFLSYTEDPKGSRSLFVRSGSSTGDAATLDFPQLSDAKAHPASDLYQFISSFSNDPLFLAFADRFCRDDSETLEEKLFHLYCHATLLDSILQDKSQTVQSHLTLFRFRTMSPSVEDLRFATDFYNKIYDRRFSGRTENNYRPPLIRENTLSGALHALDLQLDTVRADKVFLALLARYARGDGVPPFPTGSLEWAAARDLSWYLQRNSVPVATLLIVLKGLAHHAHEQCLGSPPPQGTTNAGLLDQGIKEVLHAAGTQMTTAMGSGWSIRSLDEIIAAWNAP